MDRVVWMQGQDGVLLRMDKEEALRFIKSGRCLRVSMRECDTGFQAEAMCNPSVGLNLLTLQEHFQQSKHWSGANQWL